MIKAMTALLTVMALFCLLAFRPTSSVPTKGPEYTGNQLKLPENYREWIYLSSGFDMSYSQTMDMGHHMFDNVYVNPEAYQAFLESGTWPDKTMLVLEA